MDYYEIVTKLIGPTSPVGDTSIDEVTLGNVRDLIELTDRLLFRIEDLACYAADERASVKRIGLACKEFMNNL